MPPPNAAVVAASRGFATPPCARFLLPVVTLDALHEPDLPPKAVPPRVLVQAPPFGWGVVQEAEVG